MVKSKRFSFSFVICVFSVVLVLTALLSLTLGTQALAFNRIFAIVTGQGTGLENFILFNLRLPRLLIVLLAGVSIVISGALLQTLLKNDLADPGIIGVNSGAGVGVALFFLFVPFQVETFGRFLPLAGGIFGIITAFLIVLFSKNNPRLLILNGIGFSFALSGLMVLLMSSADRNKVDFLAKWLSGSIWGTDWVYVVILALVLFFCLPFIFYHTKVLDILLLDEYTAVNLGLKTSFWRVVLLLLAVILAAVAVSVTGTITFLGLIGPHIAKSFVGPKHRYLLPISMLIGGELFLLADIISKYAHLPVGILLAFIGSPYFIYLLLRKNH
ncbi:iron ABC transporter permease [Listeria sp. PSOL-1]|uniref:FecCD family ABC transporter permease n=1 Tax=Listeria sp. PSOL-1 TaxID=1844999 RepID=UPI0013D6044D|nr:iron ABC transporter permease [Listeria sp. PSOL-1]